MSVRSGIVLGILLAACGGSGAEFTQLRLGDPNPGLSPERLNAFFRGKAVFERRFTRSEGHGPDFNTSSCASCHEIPVPGGSSPRYRNFFIARNFDGSNYFEDNQLVARTFSYTRKVRESMVGAPIVGQRNSPPIFGVGKFEHITAADIFANEDAADRDGDGISGRANRDGTAVGRFGYKAQEGGLEDFLRGPLFNHMGITTEPLSFGPSLAQVSAPQQPTTDQDGVPDPELHFQDLLDLLTWTQELAPPQPLIMNDAAARGEQVFEQIGCAKCHIKNIVSSGEPIDAYSDLLLHDMGPQLADGIAMGLATASEFRTQPLWGLRFHAPYLHDGRADTIEEAILLHGGEALAARNAYSGLVLGSKRDLTEFLETR